MKNKAIYLLMLAAAFVTFSCSKKSDVTPTATTYTFTVNGNTYTQISAADSASSVSGGTVKTNTLGVTGQSADKSAAAAMLFFWAGTSKPKAGTYTIYNDATKLSSTQVAIFILDQVTVAKQGFYGATGLDGATVTVTINSAGKVLVNMNTTAISGTNINNTDPKNSVLTSVTGTISGSAGEQ